MNARRARVAVLTMLTMLAMAGALVSGSSAHDTLPPNANAILARVKAGLRARTRPPYVVYTLDRRDAMDSVPDLLNSYVLRIWCRTADNAALARRSFGAGAVGPADFITPAFDEPIDPGPPTADLLDVIQAQGQTQARPTPAPSVPTASTSALPQVIGSVSVFIESAYRVTYAGIAGKDDHLQLEARRDPQRNRLTDLYVDRVTAEIHRAVAHDHLYADGRAIPERFEIDFGMDAGVPVITAIHGQTDYAAFDSDAAGEPLHEVTYRFEDITFPAELPAWYFEPAEYGAHRNELPR